MLTNQIYSTILVSSSGGLLIFLTTLLCLRILTRFRSLPVAETLHTNTPTQKRRRRKRKPQVKFDNVRDTLVTVHHNEPESSDDNARRADSESDQCKIELAQDLRDEKQWNYNR